MSFSDLKPLLEVITENEETIFVHLNRNPANVGNNERLRCLKDGIAQAKIGYFRIPDTTDSVFVKEIGISFLD